MAPLQAMFVIESLGSKLYGIPTESLLASRQVSAWTRCLSYFIFPKRKKGIIQFTGTP